MSKIDELIAKLCPDGVEYRELGSLLSYEQPTKYLVSSTAYSDDYETPVLTAGKTFILGYTNDEEGIYPSSPEAPVIIFDDFTTDFKWVDFPFKAKSSAMKMLHANGPQWNLRYVFHAMQTLSFVPQGHKRHWIGVYSHLEIPVPPMEIQKEIVKVLDSFITLEAELEAELEARKAQYRYYRNQLLSFERERVQWLRLADCCSQICSGATPNKKNLAYYQDATIPWLRTQEVRYADITSISGRISELALKETAAKLIPKNCVIIAISGASAGRCAINKIECATNQHCLNLKINPEVALYKYVYHCVCNQTEELLSRKEGARGDLNATKIKSMKIPVPSLATQRKVVDILDRFDSLTTSLTGGLPAEIEARRQQYSHYRDQLLSLPRKSS